LSERGAVTPTAHQRWPVPSEDSGGTRVIASVPRRRFPG